MKRIPLIKFPNRHPKSSLSSSSSGTQSQTSTITTNSRKLTTSKSDVPASPSSLGVGGKASLQPKRTLVSDKEMEAILLGGCI
ncbi:uncharacterized protein LOC130806672 [Amaranthus tricolor]|uniref:uncharacterized protein LOC130806672 n=1 Tax=Amaranthus tricolor TaxID=29722 RepID=UPI00258F2F5E|nr:uncharacterized protein LOC130806672 [Amaranthus tricolor]